MDISVIAGIRVLVYESIQLDHRSHSFCNVQSFCGRLRGCRGDGLRGSDEPYRCRVVEPVRLMITRGKPMVTSARRSGFANLEILADHEEG